MDTTIIVALLVMLATVIALGAVAISLERENRYLRKKCRLLERIIECSDQMIASRGRIIAIYEQRDRERTQP